MRCEEERAETSVKKLVMHDKMQVSDEDLMERRLSARFDTFLHEMTWQPSINGLAQRLSDVMFRRTLESPITEKHLC